MRPDREKLARIHRRASALQKVRDCALLRGWGAASLSLFLCLLGLTAAFYTGHSLAEDGAHAASLLSESTGAYVIVGVLSFMLGVMLTVFLMRRRKRDIDKKNTEERRKRL